jgi:hypothetical protein
MDQLPEGWRAAVVADLGELPHPRERCAVVASVLAALWQWRHKREPVLLVIEEAHIVCPAVPTDHNQALAIEHAVPGPRKAASTACTSSSPPSGRTSSTRRSSRSARTSCS